MKKFILTLTIAAFLVAFINTANAQWTGTGPVTTTDDVGIGVTSPLEKSHVAGDVKINGTGYTIGGSNIENAFLKIGNNLGMDNNEIYFSACRR